MTNLSDIITPSNILTETSTDTLTNKTLTSPAITNMTLGGTAVTSTAAELNILDGVTSTAAELNLLDGLTDIGYKNIPQNLQNANYTLVLADSGKHIHHAATDGTARTWTIPANSSVAYPIGTAITFTNLSTADVTIAITSDSLYHSTDQTAGSRTLAQYGIATALKVYATKWVISGNGLT